MFPFLCFSRVSFLQIAFLSHPFVIFASSLECVVFVALYNYISSHHSFFFFLGQESIIFFSSVFSHSDISPHHHLRLTASDVCSRRRDDDENVYVIQ